MAKRTSTKAADKASKAKAPKGGTADEGVAKAAAYNASVADAGDVAPTGVVTWPTEYGNPDMAVPPATPVVIADDGAAEPAAGAHTSDAADGDE